MPSERSSTSRPTTLPRNEAMRVATVDVDAVRGVEAPPVTRPGFDPGVALGHHPGADGPVLVGIEVAGHVTCGDPAGPQHGQGQMREVLADAAAGAERLDRRGVDIGHTSHVVERVVGPTHHSLDGVDWRGLA